MPVLRRGRADRDDNVFLRRRVSFAPGERRVAARGKRLRNGLSQMRQHSPNILQVPRKAISQKRAESIRRGKL